MSGTEMKMRPFYKPQDFLFVFLNVNRSMKAHMYERMECSSCLDCDCSTVIISSLDRCHYPSLHALVSNCSLPLALSPPLFPSISPSFPLTPNAR